MIKTYSILGVLFLGIFSLVAEFDVKPQMHTHQEVKHEIVYNAQGLPVGVNFWAYNLQVPIIDGMIWWPDAVGYSLRAYYDLESPEKSTGLPSKSQSQTSGGVALPIKTQSFEHNRPKIEYVLPEAPSSIKIVYGDQVPQTAGCYVRLNINSCSNFTGGVASMSDKEFANWWCAQIAYQKYCCMKYHMTPAQKDKMMSTCRYKNFTQQLLADDTLSDEVVLELWQQFCDSKSWPFGNDQKKCKFYIQQILAERRAKQEHIIRQKLEQLCLEQAQKLQKNIVQQSVTDAQELLRVQQETIRAMFDQEREILPALSDEWVELQGIYQDYDLCDDGRYARRQQAVSNMAHDGYAYETKSYTITPAAIQFLHEMNLDFNEYQACYGNQLQQVIHQECIEGIDRLTLLQASSMIHPHKESLLQCFDAARQYNQAGLVEKATTVVDFCSSLLDYGKAIIQGAAAGVVGAIEDILEHPGQAVLCAVAGEYVLAYQLSKVLYNVVDIGATYAFDPERGKKEWDEYVAPVAELIDVITKKELSLNNVIKSTTQFAVQWKAQGKLLNGLHKFCNTAKAKAVEFVKNNPLAQPEQYMTTPEGILLQSVHHVQKPTSDQGSFLTKREQILPQMQSYEQARNKALDIIGNVDPHTVQPHIGTVGIGEGKITGINWHNGKVTLRLDWDPVKQAHINITDYRAGSGRSGKSIAIPFKGDESLIESLLKHLNNPASIDAAINNLQKSRNTVKLDLFIQHLKDKI